MPQPQSLPFLPIFLLLLATFFTGPVTAEPAEKKSEEKPAAKEPAELPLLFDEDNQTFPQERFKTVRQGGAEWQMGKRWTWQETIQLVRPQQIGIQAELAATLEFPPLAKDGDQAETRLGFVFADSQICSVAFFRVRKSEKTIGEMRVLREMGALRPLRIPVRSFVQKDDLPNGTYTLHVRGGALSISLDGKELGSSCFETHFAPAVGVVIGQESGKTSCLRLILRGAGFPEPLTPEKKNVATKASALNEEAMVLHNAKKYEEALAKTKEALVLYRQAHGDKHNDVSNSLYNVATVLKNMEQTAEAIPFYEEAIKIRTKLFGEDHPDVALLEMELTTLLVGRKMLKEAFPHCLAAHFSFSKYYGSENKNTIVTQQLLDKLSRPEKRDET
ncbi:MAG: tetratricopeptide repeat protein [Pirellulaceae bacterium]